MIFLVFIYKRTFAFCSNGALRDPEALRRVKTQGVQAVDVREKVMPWKNCAALT